MVKTQEHWHFVGCLTIVIHIRKWRLIVCVIMVMSWRLFVIQSKACHPLRLKPFRYIQKYQTQLYICHLWHLCARDSLHCECLYAHKFQLTLIEWIIRSLSWSVNCDVTGPLWRHQKAVSCLGWDKSISDTRRLSRTPGCMRQDDLTTVLSHSGISYTCTMMSYSEKVWACVQNGITQQGRLADGDMTTSP